MTMNFLDRAIHLVAPGWSEKRQAARARVDVLQQLDKLLPGAGASASMGGGEGGAFGNPSAAGGRWWRTTPRDARFDTLRHLPTQRGASRELAVEFARALGAGCGEKGKAEGKRETILFCLSGHGHFDMTSYTNYLSGKLVDQAYDEKELAMALSMLPKVDA